jgi:hypothetical protein
MVTQREMIISSVVVVVVVGKRKCEGGGGGLHLPTVNSFEGSSTSLPEATLTLIFVV